jgi:acyl carrier protein
MTDQDLRQILLDELGNIAPEADLSTIDGAVDLRDILDIDSMDVLNLVTAIGRRLQLDIPEIDYPKLFTVDGGVAYLAARLSSPDHPSG